MSFIDNKKIFKIILESIKVLKKRAVFCAGWSTVEPGKKYTFDINSNIKDVEPLIKEHANIIHVIQAAPHDWLFSQCCATVHHGGAGTTGASLRAGKPMVICHTLGDQPFWGKKMQEMNLGAYFALKDITVTKVVDISIDIIGDDNTAIICYRVDVNLQSIPTLYNM
jgi:sterol 3beta-glucosyltransferase